MTSIEIEITSFTGTIPSFCLTNLTIDSFHSIPTGKSFQHPSYFSVPWLFCFNSLCYNLLAIIIIML